MLVHPQEAQEQYRRLNGHQPLDVRYTHPDTPESFNAVDAALGKIIDTANKKVLVVLNVGETPLGPGLDKGVPGIGAYDLRHGAVFDSRAVFIVDKDYYEGSNASNNHLDALGLHAQSGKPTLFPIDMKGMLHFQALVDGLKQPGDNDVKRLPWAEIGAIQSFYWSPAADELTDLLRADGWTGENILHPQERSKAVLELNNKVKMMRAFKEHGLDMHDFSFGYSEAELVKSFQELSQRTGTNKLYMKLGQAVSGLGNQSVRSVEELKEKLAKLPEGYLAQHGALIEPEFEIFFSPGVVFHIDGNAEVTILSVSDQITEGATHLGNVDPSLVFDKNYQHLLPSLYKGTLAYAQEAASRGVTNITMGLDFLAVKGKEGNLQLIPSDPNGRHTGSSHMHAVKRKILNGHARGESLNGLLTDNNVKVERGTTPDDLAQVYLQHGWHLPEFREHNSEQSCSVTTLNAAPAMHAKEPAESKVQVAMMERFNPQTPIADVNRAMQALRKEVHSILKRV